MGMGLRFEQDRHSDDGICEVRRWDLVKIWAGNGNRIPPPPPPPQLQGPQLQLALGTISNLF